MYKSSINKNTYFLNWKQAFIIVLINLALLYGSDIFLSIFISRILPLEWFKFLGVMYTFTYCIFLSILIIAVNKLMSASIFSQIKLPKSSKIFTILILVILNILFETLILNIMYHYNNEEFSKYYRNIDFDTTIYLRSFFTILIQSTLEEILFRAILLKGLIKKYNTSLVIIIVSCAFALSHNNYNFFISYFVTSIIISLIYIYTKSISLAILFHILQNLFAFSFGYFITLKMIDLSMTTSFILISVIISTITFILISLKKDKIKTS